MGRDAYEIVLLEILQTLREAEERLKRQGQVCLTKIITIRGMRQSVENELRNYRKTIKPKF